MRRVYISVCRSVCHVLPIGTATVAYMKMCENGGGEEEERRRRRRKNNHIYFQLLFGCVRKWYSFKLIRRNLTQNKQKHQEEEEEERRRGGRGGGMNYFFISFFAYYDVWQFSITTRRQRSSTFRLENKTKHC